MMKLYYLKIAILITIALIFIVGVARAAEWNEKPVMCADHTETFVEIVEKGQQLVWTSVQFTKVKGPNNTYRELPEYLTFALYVNPETRTYTALEYHPKYLVYCITSWGTDLLFNEELDPNTYYQPDRDVFK